MFPLMGCSYVVTGDWCVWGGLNPTLSTTLFSAGYFPSVSEQLREPRRGLGARGVARPWGQDSGNLVLAFAWPLAYSMALGLAFPYAGSRLDFLGKRQQEWP